MGKWMKLLPLLLIFGLMTAVMPLATAESPRVTSVAAGFDCSFAVMDDGTLWAWGDNSYGLLGIGNNETQTGHVRTPIDHVKAISPGSRHILALKDDGTVWAWGRNDFGQLGDGTTNDSLMPVRVKGLADVKAIAAGGSHSLALKDDGTVWAWGLGNRGQLGTGIMDVTGPDGKLREDVRVSVPTQVKISDVVAIDSGTSHSVALKADGTVWAWGDVKAVAVGDGNYDNHAIPALVPVSNITVISCGDDNVLALKDDGTVWAWGNNQAFALGNATTGWYQPSPVRVDRLNDASLVCTNGWVSFAITRDGRALAWGDNMNGRLGNGHYFSDCVEVPEQVVNLTDVVTISAGYRHCLAIRDDGTVWGWGANNLDQLGIGLFDVKLYLPDGTIAVLKTVLSDGTVINDTPPDESFQSMPVPAQVFAGEQPADVNRTILLPLTMAKRHPVPDLTPRPVNVSLPAGNGWGIAMGKPVQYITDDESGNVYAFMGNDVRCIGPDGDQKWSLHVPDGWKVCENRARISMMISGGGAYVAGSYPRPVYAMSDDTLYLYVMPDTEYTNLPGWYENYYDAAAVGMTWAVLAISPEGRIEWTYTRDMFPKKYDDTFVGARDGRVYVYQGYTETVLDRNGSVLFEITDVGAPAAVDERGNIYVTDAAGRQSGAAWTGDGYADFRVPYRNIRAYDASGTLLWQKDMIDNIQWNYVVEDLRPEYGTTPVYKDGTLYVPLRSGVEALDTDGNVKWSDTMDAGSYHLFPLMPIDSNGNVYLENQHSDEFDFTHDIYVINKEGKIISGPRKYDRNYMGTVARDGIIYDVSWELYGDQLYGWPTCPENLTAYTVRAYDIINDSVLWAYAIPADNVKTVTVDRGNLRDLFGQTMAEWELRNVEGQSLEVIESSRHRILEESRITLYLGGSTLYVVAQVSNYEHPIVFGQSYCAYISGIYAIDTKGSIAYEKPLDGFVTAAMVNNSTLFYGTGNGGLSAVTVGAVAGLALLGAIAIAAKFFLFGSVARARSRLDKNENRNLVMAYIRTNPGSTLNEISRGMRMNLGTVRYHLFILSMNHKTATFNDGKFVRYFPNSNFYSKEEQQIIALLRRENTKQILQSLLDSPGLSNAELSERLYQPHSAINVYLKELVAKGVTVRENAPDGRQVYSLESRYREMIVSLSQRLACGI